MSNVLLNISNILHRSRVNGPGLRSVVWVQGCTLNCPGCFNPHTHPHRPVKLVDPRELGRELIALPDTEGLTISGGEPFQQAEACAILARTVREAGRSVMVFTGYTHDCLQASADPDVQRFLQMIDLLIAGPYVQGLATDGKRWLGSSNQRIVPLTDRYAREVTDVQPDSPIVEVKTDGGEIRLTGFPEEQDLTWMQHGFTRDQD